MTQSSTWPLLPLHSQACARLTTWTYIQFIRSRLPTGAAIRLDIKLYDKRMEEKFLRMMLQRYPHATSSALSSPLSPSSKLDLLDRAQYTSLCPGTHT
jgi:hypothetical protein